MDKKVSLKQLVDSGSNIRHEFISTAIVSKDGEHQIGEFWDANKMLGAIANREGKEIEYIKQVIDTINEYIETLDLYIEQLENRIVALENNAIVSGENDSIDSSLIKNGTIKIEDLDPEVIDRLNTIEDQGDDTNQSE